MIRYKSTSSSYQLVLSLRATMSSSPVTPADRLAADLAELRVMALRLRDEFQLLRRDFEVDRRRTDLVYDLLTGRRQPVPAALAPTVLAVPSPAVPSPALSPRAPLSQSLFAGQPPDLTPTANPSSFAAGSPPWHPDTAPPDLSPTTAGPPSFSGWSQPMSHSSQVRWPPPSIPNAGPSNPTAAPPDPCPKAAPPAVTGPACSVAPLSTVPPVAASPSSPPLSTAFHAESEPPQHTNPGRSPLDAAPLHTSNPPPLAAAPASVVPSPTLSLAPLSARFQAGWPLHLNPTAAVPFPWATQKPPPIGSAEDGARPDGGTKIIPIGPADEIGPAALNVSFDGHPVEDNLFVVAEVSFKLVNSRPKPLAAYLFANNKSVLYKSLMGDSAARYPPYRPWKLELVDENQWTSHSGPFLISGLRTSRFSSGERLIRHIRLSSRISLILI